MTGGATGTATVAGVDILVAVIVAAHVDIRTPRAVYGPQDPNTTQGRRGVDDDQVAAAGAGTAGAQHDKRARGCTQSSHPQEDPAVR